MTYKPESTGSKREEMCPPELRAKVAALCPEKAFEPLSGLFLLFFLEQKQVLVTQDNCAPGLEEIAFCELWHVETPQLIQETVNLCVLIKACVFRLALPAHCRVERAVGTRPGPGGGGFSLPRSLYRFNSSLISYFLQSPAHTGV